MTQLDTSRSILEQTTHALAMADDQVSVRAEAAVDPAIEHALVLSSTECQPVVTEACFMEIYRREMDQWSQALAGMRAARGTLLAWEAANDEWEDTGQEPSRWAEVVCRPVAIMVETVVRLLLDVGVDVPELLTRYAPLAESLCGLVGGGEDDAR